ncbi:MULTISPECIES: hypothetical protein [unclassified Streptomyces]|uniref:hypothetical protein n=1 Tax=unclassified Streptomyces TaxID=2593676 RepID=UPI002DD96239|nr:MULTISPECIES: hypothetical protein [unclassified Streptomyces]WSA96870.1 hypothetical protein OIE63_38935 [Streptomyces sp. NBC_01795]WSB81286.1 hypothetical protein OHB04_40055 [Streptomyces sp. NBC_01775]WSS10505.1 hypothetical protein OG533_00210 [Streptomyces sp. NBC_01186]WSS39201.1 hypothetical protein OG220_00225 [Streptomyces sp. NBC_01187]
MRTIRLATLGAALCALLAAGTATSQASASTTGAAAPRCEREQVTWYPGSLVGRYRIAQWDMNVLVCPDKAPEDWKTNSDVEINATGSNLGVTLKQNSLTTTETGENQWNRYARYEGHLQTRSCLPKVGWPCDESENWKAWFTITVDKRTGEVNTHLQGARTPPGATWALFRTP